MDDGDDEMTTDLDEDSNNPESSNSSPSPPPPPLPSSSPFSKSFESFDDNEKKSTPSSKKEKSDGSSSSTSTTTKTNKKSRPNKGMFALLFHHYFCVTPLIFLFGCGVIFFSIKPFQGSVRHHSVLTNNKITQNHNTHTKCNCYPPPL